MPAVPDSAVARLLAAPACLVYIYPFAVPAVPSCSTCLRSLLATPACMQCLLAATTCTACWRYLLAVLARRTNLSSMPAILASVSASVPDCDTSACLQRLPVVPVMPVVSPGSVHALACRACLPCLFACRAHLLYLLAVRVPACGTHLHCSPAMPPCRAPREPTHCAVFNCSVYLLGALTCGAWLLCLCACLYLAVPRCLCACLLVVLCLLTVSE